MKPPSRRKDSFRSRAQELLAGLDVAPPLSARQTSSLRLDGVLLVAISSCAVSHAEMALTPRLFLMPFSVSHSTCKPPSSLSVVIPAMDRCRLPHISVALRFLVCARIWLLLGHHSDGVITASLQVSASISRAPVYRARCTGSLRLRHMEMNPVITDEVALKVIPPFLRGFPLAGPSIRRSHTPPEAKLRCEGSSHSCDGKRLLYLSIDTRGVRGFAFQPQRSTPDIHKRLL